MPEPDAQRLDVGRLTAVGLGLDKRALRLERTSTAWVAEGSGLRDAVAERLHGVVADVAHIGSSSVETLLAKPIVDLAVGLGPGHPLEPITDRLQSSGWIHRGDAGDDGGHVFVLEAAELVRVAHLHVVEYEGRQWRNYLRLRDVLRRDPDARARYEAVKQRLIAQVDGDRERYTEGKSDVIAAVLAESTDH